MAIALRLLGMSDLVGPDGQRLLPVLAQPKRFALLSYLALSRPHGLHRRDALLAMFWPDLDEEHARGALSQALSFLRRSLGEGAIVTRSGDLVGLAEEALRCDVLEFESAADAGDHARASALYVGELLASFHVPDCQPFDLWLASERQRLRDRALRSSRIASLEAEGRGDGTGGFLSARRAVELAPYDEASIRRLMLSLTRAGRRGRALEEYHQFVTRLKEDLDMEPSADIRALAEEIRVGTRGGPSAEPEPREAPPPPPGPALTSPPATPAPAAPPAEARAPAGMMTRRHYFVYVALMLAIAGAAAAITQLLALPAIVTTLVVLISALLVPLLALLAPRA